MVLIDISMSFYATESRFPSVNAYIQMCSILKPPGIAVIEKERHFQNSAVDMHGGGNVLFGF